MKDSTYFRPPSFPPDNNVNASNNDINNHGQGFSFYQHQQIGLDQQDLIMNPSLLDNQLMDIPRLDSPTISTSFVPTNVLKNNITNGEYEVDDIDGGSNSGGSRHNHNQYFDWKNLDNLLMSSQLTIPPKFPQSNLITINSNAFGLEAQSQTSQFHGYFPDS